MSVIEGTVTDAAGAPAVGRVIRIYRRDSGALLGATQTSDGVTVTPEAATWSGSIAGEGSNFTVAAGSVVRYGADTRWYEKTYSAGGTFGCNSDEFGGDPASGTPKRCELRSAYVAEELLDAGYYKIDLAYVGEVMRVVLDDAGGDLLNDLIDRVELA